VLVGRERHEVTGRSDSQARARSGGDVQTGQRITEILLI
jgi:hypothetical protein